MQGCKTKSDTPLTPNSKPSEDDMRKYNFADFRTYDAIQNALFWYCDAVTISKGIRGTCPNPKCQDSKRRTLVCFEGNPVAHCYKCQRTYDALAIVVIAERVGLWHACEKLQHFVG